MIHLTTFLIEHLNIETCFSEISYDCISVKTCLTLSLIIIVIVIILIIIIIISIYYCTSHFLWIFSKYFDCRRCISQ